jgi:hypothetical protein
VIKFQLFKHFQLSIFFNHGNTFSCWHLFNHWNISNYWYFFNHYLNIFNYWFFSTIGKFFIYWDFSVIDILSTIGTYSTIIGHLKNYWNISSNGSSLTKLKHFFQVLKVFQLWGCYWSLICNLFIYKTNTILIFFTCIEYDYAFDFY